MDPQDWNWGNHGVRATDDLPAAGEMKRRAAAAKFSLIMSGQSLMLVLRALKSLITGGDSCTNPPVT